MHVRKKIVCAVLLLVSMSSIRTMQEHSKLSSSMAQSWEELEGHKKTVYLSCFTSPQYSSEFLEKLWESLKQRFNNGVVSILLVKKGQDCVGIVPVRVSGNNAVLSSSVILPTVSCKEAFEAIPLEIKKHYPNVTSIE
jgi:hypothetical protein